MLDRVELQILGTWCKQRGMSWTASARDGCPVLLLLPRQAGAWESMTLLVEGAELRLENGSGETLASASGLQALLDAVDGGVGEGHVRRVAGLATVALPLVVLLGSLL